MVEVNFSFPSNDSDERRQRKYKGEYCANEATEIAIWYSQVLKGVIRKNVNQMDRPDGPEGDRGEYGKNTGRASLKTGA